MQKYRYVVVNKPYGVLSSFTDESSRPTLKEYVPVPGVYAAGRLDFDSEGLLLLTDDGELIHRLTDPEHHLPKTYLVQVEGTVTPGALAELERGVEIQGWRTRRCTVVPLDGEPDLPPRAKPITPHGPTAWLHLTLTEGKKRQIRHMTAAVGLPTLRLVRIAIGPLSLGGLLPGEWRELSAGEVVLLKQKSSSGLRRRRK